MLEFSRLIPNSLKIAARGLLCEKTYGVVSIVGLSVAMACSILVCAFIIEQYRYVNYFENGHRIYRILREVRHEGGASFGDWVSGGTVVAIREQFPEVEVAARASASYYTRRWIRSGDKTLAQFFCRADPEFLDVFGFRILRGSLSNDRMTVVVREPVARKFFGDADPIGQTITLIDAGPTGDYTITGVLQDIPKYASMKIDFLTASPPTAYVTQEQRSWDGWHDNLWGPKSFVRLPEGMSPEPIERSLNEVMSRSISPESSSKTTLFLQPMTETHLYSYGKPGDGAIEMIKSLAMIALIIVAVACANFVNLSVARTVARTREIAARKAVGAGRLDIFVQLVTESITICGVALFLGLGLATFAPGADFFGGSLKGSDLLTWQMVAAMVALLFLVGLVAGAYPALVASRIRATDASSGAVTTGGIRVRTLLLVGQLACSVFFIASALIVGSQLSLMDSADPGFDRDRVLTTRYVFNDSVMASKREVIKTAFTKLPGVESATTLWPGPGAETTIWTGYREADPQTQFDFQILGVDPDFLQTYGVKLIAGRNVGPDFVKYSDAEFVINETTVKMLGWNTEEGPLGKALRVGDMRGHVIGIVKDFHYASLRKAIPPLVLVNWSRIALAVRIRPDHVDETMADIERTWKQFFDQPNELKPVDSFWGWCNYRERRLRRGYTYLSWSALFLAGLGVFGLAAYEAEQRRREVGVRKVLGASIGSIVSLFWRSHVKLVVLAIIIAWPLPFFLMRDWLANFAYRIDLTALPFVVSGGATTVLFLAVVGSQAMRIGRVDPAETLRRE